MEEKHEEQTVRRVELAISAILRTGVSISLAMVVLGIIVSFTRHPDYVSSATELRRLTRPGAAFPHTLRDVGNSLGNLRGQGIVMLGLLLLIATPVMRVAVSILAFVVQRDWMFVVITSLVLALLVLSFVLGRVEG